MNNEIIREWSNERKLKFLKEGNRRVFYKEFGLYYSYADNVAQLTTVDYRTGHVNKLFSICQINTKKYSEKQTEEMLIKMLNYVIRKVKRETA